MTKLRSNTFKITFSVVISIAVAFAAFGFFLNTRQSPPRNVRILVGESMSAQYTLFEVEGSSFQVIVFSTLRTLTEDNQELPDITLGTFDIGGKEPIDMTLLDDFAESFWCPGLWSVLGYMGERYGPHGITEQWSVELSQGQSDKLWRLVDSVVVGYSEPERICGTNILLTRAIIEDGFYWSLFSPGETYSSDFMFRLRNRNRYRHYNRNLLVLTRYLADLAPVRLGWE
ncbi:MAG: hypothetical protein FWC70_11935 [Defluviitaleaceae bacterium]|nr:hypothetical protein [Defluviitaleaceae bacterium]